MRASKQQYVPLRLGIAHLPDVRGTRPLTTSVYLFGGVGAVIGAILGGFPAAIGAVVIGGLLGGILGLYFKSPKRIC